MSIIDTYDNSYGALLHDDKIEIYEGFLREKGLIVLKSLNIQAMP